MAFQRPFQIVVLILGAAVGADPASARAGEGGRRTAVPAGLNSPSLQVTERLQPRAHPEAAAFEARAGGNWWYQWNPRTGAPHAVFGSGCALGGGLLTDEPQVEEVARSFVLANQGLLWIDPGQLQVRSIAGGHGKWGVVFDQFAHGLEVEGARLRLALTDSSRLYFFGSDCFPDVPVEVVPHLGRETAFRLAARALGLAAGRITDEGGELIIRPITGESGIDFRLAWRIHQRSAEPIGRWVSYVDARDGRILLRRDEISSIDVIGSTAGNVEDRSYCDGEQDRSLPNMKVNIQGDGSGYSDPEGSFDIPYEGTSPVQLTARLDGRWIQVDNIQGPDALFSGVAVPGVPFEIRWNDSNSLDPERCAYLHVNRIHDLVKHYDPDWTAPDYRMPVRVNDNYTCGANWDGGGMSFGREGFGCANTARLGDVAYHEYAHGITQWIYGDQPGDVGEGNSDAAAAFITGDHIIGRGFYLDDCEHGIRDVQNDRRYPEDYHPGDLFGNGLIVSGFWWDTYQALIAHYGQQEALDVAWSVWHFSRRHFQPVSIPDQVLYAFVEDDDDGDLSNGTPHFAEFCVGAGNHGFDCPVTGTPQDSRKPALLSLESGTPNPLISSTSLSYVIPPSAGRNMVTLRVYDFAGRGVRTLVAEPQSAGAYRVAWNGEDDHGRRLPGAVYYFDLTSRGERRTGHIVVVR